MTPSPASGRAARLGYDPATLKAMKNRKKRDVWAEAMKELGRVLILAHNHPEAQVCAPVQAKTRLGVKFWCYVCKRYVLPDKRHSWLV